jgi:hypothetical protein
MTSICSLPKFPWVLVVVVDDPQVGAKHDRRCESNVGGVGVASWLERWPVVGDGCWYGEPGAVVVVIGPVAALDEVFGFNVAVSPILVIGDVPIVTVARPNPPAVSYPPECEADWHVVYGA